MNTKLGVQRLCVIPDHIQATALGRPFRTKGADDHMAAWFHNPCHLMDVRNPVMRRSEKVEDGAVVPHVVGLWSKLEFSDVSDDPHYTITVVSEALSVRDDGGL